MYDVIIIGKGPAGVSSALYTSRAGLKTLIIGMQSMLEKAEKIDNYYGFSESISGKQLLENGIKQVKRFGVEVIEEEVIALEKEQYFTIKTDKGEYSSKAVLLATGSQRKKLDIQNAEKFEGSGIHFCTTCDGFFYRNKKVGLLGSGKYAMYEVNELKNYTQDIVVFTNGEKLTTDCEFPVDKRKITKIEGEGKIEKIIFENGEERKDIQGIFVAQKSASAIDFALKLGVLTQKDKIIVDKEYKTNIDGLYAAGDCVESFMQVATAVAGGAIAGKNIITYVKIK